MTDKSKTVVCKWLICCYSPTVCMFFDTKYYYATAAEAESELTTYARDNEEHYEIVRAIVSSNQEVIII